MIPTPTPAQNFATILRTMSQTVVTQGLIGRIANVLVNLLIDRFREIIWAFERLAKRIEAGTYKPRRYTPRRPPAVRKPRTSHLPAAKSGWLLPILNDYNGTRAQMEHLLRDPEMLQLLAAAPASAARLLRPICWALRLQPPKILAKPRPDPEPEPEPPQPAERQAATPRGPGPRGGPRAGRRTRHRQNPPIAQTA